MCITVNSKHNMIRKMFSVIKYLVLVFAFVFVGLCSSNLKSKAWTLDNGENKNATSSLVKKMYKSSSKIPSAGTRIESVTFVEEFGYNGYYYQFGYRKGVIIDAKGTDSGEDWVKEKQLYNTKESGNDNRTVKLVFHNKHIYHCMNGDNDDFNTSDPTAGCYKDFGDFEKYLKGNGDDWYQNGIRFQLEFEKVVYYRYAVVGAGGWYNPTTGEITITNFYYDPDTKTAIEVEIDLKEDFYFWKPKITFDSGVGGDHSKLVRSVTAKVESSIGLNNAHYAWTHYDGYGITAGVEHNNTTSAYYYDKNNMSNKVRVTAYGSTIGAQVAPASANGKKTEFRVCATSAWGGTECSQSNVTVDSVGPTVSLDSPPGTAVINPINSDGTVKQVTGSLTDNYTAASEIKLSYCWTETTNETCPTYYVLKNNNGKFSVSMPIKIEGAKKLIISATDKLGNSKKYEYTYNLDDTAPRISLTTTNGTDLTTTWSKKNVTLTIEETNIKSDGCSYIWKDSSGSAIKGGSGNCTISDNYIVIAPPSNQERELSLTVTVTDSVGNSTEPTTYNGLKIDNYAPRIVSSKLTPVGSSSKAAQNWKITVIIEDRELKDGIVNNLVCLKMSTQGKTCTARATTNSYRILTELGPEGKNMLSHAGNRYTLEFDTSKFTGKLDKLNGTYYLVVKVTDSVNDTIIQSTDQMVFDNTKPGIIEATKTKYSMTTDGTLINVENPIIGGFNVMTKMQIMDATSLSEIVTSNGRNNGYIADFENKFYIKVIGIKGNNTIIIDGDYNLLKTTEYKMIKENGNYYLMIIIGLCNRAETPTCYSVDSTKYDSLKVEVYIREDIVTDTAGNSLDLTTSSKFGKDPNKYYELTTVELRLGSKNDFTVQTVAKQETNNNNNQNEGKGSTQVTTLSSVVEREEILVEEIREANVEKVVIPLEETNMVIRVDERLVEITVEEVEEKETEKEIVVVVDENTEIVVINYGSMSYEYKVKEITSNLNREVILHELMVSNKRVLVKLKSMKEH